MTKVSKQPLEAANNPLALLRIEAVAALVGLGHTTIYRKIKAGEFPEPIRMGARCTRWRAREVAAWLSEKGETQ